MIQLFLIVLMFNAQGAEQAQTSWWFKTKCHLYHYCLPGGSLDDRTCLPHGSIKLRDALFSAIKRHSMPDVAYIFNFYARNGYSLPESRWEYEPLSRAVSCNAPAEIIRLLCKHTRVARRVEGDSLFKLTAEHNNIEAACILLEHGVMCRYLPSLSDSDDDKLIYASFASFLVALMERLSEEQLPTPIHLNITEQEIWEHYYKERTQRIADVLNASDAATYRLPTPLNAIIAEYVVEDFAPKVCAAR